MWHKKKRDWLFYLSVTWPLGGPWPFKAAKVPSPSAVSPKVWLCETSFYQNLMKFSKTISIVGQMIPQINNHEQNDALMWTYSLMAIICQLGNPVVFMTSWTHAKKGCLCVSIGLQRPLCVQIANLQFKRVPTGASVDAFTMCSFVKIALLWTSWWYPTVHATLRHNGVNDDRMSRGHHLEKRQSLLMWNK